MKWFVRVAWVLLALILLAGAAAAVLVRRSLPVMDGELHLTGLSAPVTIQRDASDVTHIRARTEPDGWRAMGWVHAQERGWQLEFNRRVMHGELSEILGEATLETDKLMRSLGILRAAQVQYDRLSPGARQALQAYSDGINAYHAGASAMPQPEFLILGAKPGVWTPVDSMGWALMMALDLGGNWGNEFARLTAAREMDTSRLWQLMPPYPGEKPAATADLAALYRELGLYRRASATENPKTGAISIDSTLATAKYAIKNAFWERWGGQAELARWAADFSRDAGTLEGKGSNNWVIAGSHTVSGKPLLANDPHLALSAPA
ncbi:MAG: penicillin acylase family protein, partial [Burkholderiaceae bacterium]|nr:penicillin acylase family protein [Burkholderiaceae bacterium]